VVTVKIKYRLTYDDVRSRLEKLPLHEKRVYGIPRGGTCCLAYLPKTCTIVDRPEDADVLIDDIIDSGVTAANYWVKYKKPTWAVINKVDNPDDRCLGWIVFPWESEKDESVGHHIARASQLLGDNLSPDELEFLTQSFKDTYNEIVRNK
jgi:hypoxanthine phosphoribosyltransferase